MDVLVVGPAAACAARQHNFFFFFFRFFFFFFGTVVDKQPRAKCWRVTAVCCLVVAAPGHRFAVAGRALLRAVAVQLGSPFSRGLCTHTGGVNGFCFVFCAL